MRVIPYLTAVAFLSIAGVRCQLRPVYTYEVCRGHLLAIAVEGDRKGPACWNFAKSTDDGGYQTFLGDIESRNFTSVGSRRKILEALKQHIPSGLDLLRYEDELINSGLGSGGIPPDFKKKFAYFIAFICCLSPLHKNIVWTEEHIKQWTGMGLDVDKVGKTQKYETPKDQPKVKKVQRAIFGLSLGGISLPSGVRLSKNFDPEKHKVEIDLTKPVEECSMADIVTALHSKDRAIQDFLLEATHPSILEEARGVSDVNLTEIKIREDLGTVQSNTVEGIITPFEAEGVALMTEAKFTIEPTVTLPSGEEAQIKLDEDLVVSISLGKDWEKINPVKASDMIKNQFGSHLKDVVLSKLHESSEPKFADINQLFLRNISIKETETELRRNMRSGKPMNAEASFTASVAAKPPSPEAPVPEAPVPKDARAPESPKSPEDARVLESPKAPEDARVPESPKAPESRRAPEAPRSRPPREGEAGVVTRTAPPPTPAPRKEEQLKATVGLKTAEILLPTEENLTVELDPLANTLEIPWTSPKKGATTTSVSKDIFRHYQEDLTKVLEKGLRDKKLKEMQGAGPIQLLSGVLDGDLKDVLDDVKQGRVIKMSLTASIVPQAKESKRIPPSPTPAAGRPQAPPEDCELYPLDLNQEIRRIRESTLDNLVTILNKVTKETDESQTAASCLKLAANADIYQRLQAVTRKEWKREVVEGAPTVSHWIAIKIQTFLDDKTITGKDEAKPAVVKNARICIDAALLVGRLMNSPRWDRLDDVAVAPATSLGNMLNLSLDDNQIVTERLTFFSLSGCAREKNRTKAIMWPLLLATVLALLFWYQRAVHCLVVKENTLPYLLAYLALPEQTQIEGYIMFVELYNEAIEHIKSVPEVSLSNVEKAAKVCSSISLAKEGVPIPVSVGNTELQRDMGDIIKIIGG